MKMTIRSFPSIILSRTGVVRHRLGKITTTKHTLLQNSTRISLNAVSRQIEKKRIVLVIIDRTESLQLLDRVTKHLKVIRMNSLQMNRTLVCTVKTRYYMLDLVPPRNRIDHLLPEGVFIMIIDNKISR